MTNDICVFSADSLEGRQQIPAGLLQPLTLKHGRSQEAEETEDQKGGRINNRHKKFFFFLNEKIHSKMITTLFSRRIDVKMLAKENLTV